MHRKKRRAMSSKKAREGEALGIGKEFRADPRAKKDVIKW